MICFQVERCRVFAISGVDRRVAVPAGAATPEDAHFQIRQEFRATLRFACLVKPFLPKPRFRRNADPSKEREPED